MTPKIFVKTYLPYAQQSQAKTGIHAHVTIAQAALESGWGEKAPGNMFFGVKANASTPPEKKQLIVTTEYLKTIKATFPEIISMSFDSKVGMYKYKVKDWFRKYDTPEECFTDHGRFFLDNPRYKKAIEVKADPVKFIQEIAKAGYATAPDYASQLIAVLKTVERNL